MVSVVYHDDLKEVQGDAALTALVSAPGATAPFDRWEWWQGLVRQCGITPLIAVARDGQHRAILPLMRKGRAIHALANWYTFRVVPVISAGADSKALLLALAQDLAGQAPHLSLAPLGDEHGEVQQLTAALRQAGWMAFQTQCDVNHVLVVGGRTFAEYLAARPGPLRTTLKRKASKVAVQLTTQFDPALWDEYEAVYAASWKPQEGAPAFLRAFAEQEGAAGRLRMAVARVDGVAVATQFWTVENGTAFIHKLAHTEASKPLSPGTTLSAALFEHVIDRDKVGLVDFGTGNDAYKRDWMEQVRPRYRIEAFRPLWPGNWMQIAKAALQSMRARG
ncbi:MAG: GNAT family N-acetyltransferase [Sphingomonadales bacterium]|nr:GNAT family N-acetyltransferase [Sphingomonadales bacterium]